MGDNFGAGAVAHLPEISLEGQRPVVQVIDPQGEVLYTRRVNGTSFQPPVFAPGEYTLKIGEPGGAMQERKATAEPVE
jgi:hypothetical protein